MDREWPAYFSLQRGVLQRIHRFLLTGEVTTKESLAMAVHGVVIQTLAPRTLLFEGVTIVVDQLVIVPHRYLPGFAAATLYCLLDIPGAPSLPADEVYSSSRGPTTMVLPLAGRSFVGTLQEIGAAITVQRKRVLARDATAVQAAIQRFSASEVQADVQ